MPTPAAVKNPALLCGAACRRTGDPCKQLAMANGHCKMHGGKAGRGRPIITGRYSVKHRASLAESVAEFLADPEPGNLFSELALLRGLTQDVLNRYPDGVPLPTSHITGISGLLDSTSKLVERIARIETTRQLTAGDAAYLIETFADLIREFVPEHDRARATESLRSRVASRSPGRALPSPAGDDD